MLPRRLGFLKAARFHRRDRVRALFVLLIAVVLATTGLSSIRTSHAWADAVDQYHVQMQAWIPQSWVTGPTPIMHESPNCISPNGLATYNGNGHVGYDGETKVTVDYVFNWNGSSMADVSENGAFGPTVAYSNGCVIHGQITTAWNVTSEVPTAATLWTSTSNPIAPGAWATPIQASLTVAMVDSTHMVLTHATSSFPSQGFRVWKNGVLTATAIDFDASCINVSGATGMKNVGAGLAGQATPIVHNLDTRLPNQSYLGPCGQPRPAPLSYPALSSVPTPRPGNQAPVAAFTASRLVGPGNQVHFNASASYDPDGSIASYAWRRGGTTIGTGKIADIALGASSSPVPVTLVVTDNRGATGSVTHTLAVGNRAPTISSVSPASGSTFFSIQPTLSAIAADPDGDPLTYSYHLWGNGVDLASGRQGGAWTIPPHSLDPGDTYSWSVTVTDGRGGSVSRTAALVIAMLPTAKQLVSTSDGAGYWQVASDGGVFAYGDAGFYGSIPGLPLKVDNIMGMARTADDRGYWLVGRDGGVYSFGDAAFYGSLPGLNIHVGNIVGMAATKTGHGYWLVGSDGGVFAFGDAQFYGSMGGKPLNAPVNSIAPTASGNGYWLGAGDGGVFAFGDAPFYGSMGGKPLNFPAVDLQPTPNGKGYWLTAQDGGVFAFGNAGFFGSMAGHPLNGRVTSISPTANGQGYWLNACDGGVFAFGNAQFYGSNPTYGCRGI